MYCNPAGSDSQRKTTSTQGERSVRGAQETNLSKPEPAHAQGWDTA